MSKSSQDFHTTAVKRAARGGLHRENTPSNRANTVYGFSNHALKKSSDELKAAWSSASSSLRMNKG